MFFKKSKNQKTPYTHIHNRTATDGRKHSSSMYSCMYAAMPAALLLPTGLPNMIDAAVLKPGGVGGNPAADLTWRRWRGGGARAACLLAAVKAASASAVCTASSAA